MILTFEELGIKVKQYKTMPWGKARQYIVNTACSYIMLHHFSNQKEEDVILDYESAFVNTNNNTVYINTVSPTIN
jgi:hypothetical protein